MPPTLSSKIFQSLYKILVNHQALVQASITPLRPPHASARHFRAGALDSLCMKFIQHTEVFEVNYIIQPPRPLPSPLRRLKYEPLLHVGSV